MLRIIKEEEPPKPSTRLSASRDAAERRGACGRPSRRKLSKLVRGDLDWIVMKALEKDRGRRYETANGLALDVQRYLADEPVLAGPPSARLSAAEVRAAEQGAGAGGGGDSPVAGRRYPRHRLGPGPGRARRQEAVAARDAAESSDSGPRQTSKGPRRPRRTNGGPGKRPRPARPRRPRSLDFVQTKVFAAARPAGQAGGLGHDVTAPPGARGRPAPSSTRTSPNSRSSRPGCGMTLGTSRSTTWATPRSAVEQLRGGPGPLHAQHLGPDHPDTLHSMNNLASSYDAVGRLADALKLREEALAW